MANLKKLFMHERFCQVIFILTTVPSIVFWIKTGTIKPATAFCAGFNCGAAVYWEFYLRQRRRTNEWRDCAFKALELRVRSLPGDDKRAKQLVELRFKSEHIDPAKN